MSFLGYTNSEKLATICNAQRKEVFIMKIEKINDNQIKCTLNKSDLASRQIKLSELAYGTEKAKSLFRDMMQQASIEFGFEAEDIPLMIEAIPVSGDCIVLVITKVEDPEELDTRFSKFAPAMDEIDAEDIDDENGSVITPSSSDLLDLFNHLKHELKNATSGNSDNFIPLSQALAKKAEQSKAVQKSEPEAPRNISKVFQFNNLDSLINVACKLKEMYNGSNRLYKDEDTNIYYLVINKGSQSVENFNKVCNILSEYGTATKTNQAGEAYYEEHYKKVIATKALQKLQMVTD